MSQATFDWCTDGGTSSKLRCVACGEVYEEAPWGDGMVFDLVHFMALCKRCIMLIVRNGAGKWPAEIAAELGKGLQAYPGHVAFLKEYFPDKAPKESL